MEIVSRQLWNQDFYITYTLRRRQQATVKARPYFDLARVEEQQTEAVVEFEHAAFTAGDATLRVDTSPANLREEGGVRLQVSRKSRTPPRK